MPCSRLLRERVVASFQRMPATEEPAKAKSTLSRWGRSDTAGACAMAPFNPGAQAEPRLPHLCVPLLDIYTLVLIPWQRLPDPDALVTAAGCQQRPCRAQGSKGCRCRACCSEMLCIVLPTPWLTVWMSCCLCSQRCQIPPFQLRPTNALPAADSDRNLPMGHRAYGCTVRADTCQCHSASYLLGSRPLPSPRSHVLQAGPPAPTQAPAATTRTMAVVKAEVSGRLKISTANASMSCANHWHLQCQRSLGLQ